jgi:ubiquinone/menaquinone biosynthesis C-methylase UbiE
MAGSLGAVRRAYARTAAEYDERWRHYLEVTISRTIAAIPATPGAPLLDVGCGTGVLIERVMARYPDLRVTGADPSPEMLAVARARVPAGARLVLAVAEALPFPSGTFGVVVTSSSLHHWRDPAMGLREIARVLGPAGLLVLTDWRADHLPTRLRDVFLRLGHPSHGRALTVAAARAALRAAGFRVTHVDRYAAGWSWGLMTVTATCGP